MHKFGARKWKPIAEHIGTRTPEQVRSHAQKHFGRGVVGSDAESMSTGSTSSPPTTSVALQALATAPTE